MNATEIKNNMTPDFSKLESLINTKEDAKEIQEKLVNVLWLCTQALDNNNGIDEEDIRDSANIVYNLYVAIGRTID